jgi:hypothetical protein
MVSPILVAYIGVGVGTLGLISSFMAWFHGSHASLDVFTRAENQIKGVRANTDRLLRSPIQRIGKQNR